MCILLEEPAWKLYLTELCKVDSLHMSTATRAETHLSAKGKKGQAGAVKMDELIEFLNIRMIDFGSQDIAAFQDASDRYHATARPSGPLNMGDIFAYVLATQLDMPLFFQGMDFLQTPVKNAMHILGYQMTIESLGMPCVVGQSGQDIDPA